MNRGQDGLSDFPDRQLQIGETTQPPRQGKENSARNSVKSPSACKFIRRVHKYLPKYLRVLSVDVRYAGLVWRRGSHCVVMVLTFDPSSLPAQVDHQLMDPHQLPDRQGGRIGALFSFDTFPS